jgi:DNA helicase II / ATP-dependent DNA helicase PcrA
VLRRSALLQETESTTDVELDTIVAEEEACLARVLDRLAQRKTEREKPRPDFANYDVRLLELRDQIASARLEDVPPLVQEMERLQVLANHLRESEAVEIDTRSPYFGRMVLEENGKRREVLIGRATYLDTKFGVRIVDWRDAPVSRLYYRYEQGDGYDEVFGEREVSGEVVTRRSVVIHDGVLRRIASPQGTFVRASTGWRRLDSAASRLTGGAGKALRPEQHHRPGKLGVGGEAGEDKHLKEITALIDARQFDLITRADSGLVVIQGGAGSGKTTIGLHRLAYLAFRDARRFRPDRMLVVVFNDALVRYISQVLPALGIQGVAVRTYVDWARRQRETLYPRVTDEYREDTPGVVTRLKKHPAMLKVVDAYVAELAAAVETDLGESFNAYPERRDSLLALWRKSAGRPLAHRLHAIAAIGEGDAGKALGTDERVALERVTRTGLRKARDVVGAWADLLSDRSALGSWLAEFAPGEFSTGAIDRAHAYCSANCHEVVTEFEMKAAARSERPRSLRRKGGEGEDVTTEDDFERDSDPSPRTGIDGLDIHDKAALDVEDDTLLLMLHQRLRGPLTRGTSGKDPIVYEHVLVDEAQDYSPTELSVIFETVSKAKSITLAGDVQQRLLLDNGFSDWNTVLGELGLAHVEVEPLKLSYRSTYEIVQFARAVLGPLASPEEPVAPRHGAPVELFEFGHAGDAVAHLSEALRELMQTEPSASICVIARYPEQADAYFHGLHRAEVPYLRRVADQDFSFKSGIDVTDVRQVKGLEFDYVVLVDVSDNAYPVEDEARHLAHIGATRAAHQLWVLTTGRPSPLLPRELLEAAP